MINRLVLVFFIAIAAYFLFPLFFSYLIRKNRRHILSRLQSEKAVTGLFSAASLHVLEFELTDKTAGEPGKMMVPFKKNLFLTVSEDGVLKKTDPKEFALIKLGTMGLIFPAQTKRQRGLCILFTEALKPAQLPEPENLQFSEKPDNPAKPFCVMGGAFLEFLVFLESLRHPELGFVSFTAFAAIFGKAIPYCPPGFFLPFLTPLFMKLYKNEEKKELFKKDS
ncbi:hypothetical protein K7I13_06605 [Brucepastera parasyntrophica]|uniref:hypothetical protein n=1 Tax=Brucepastera parasyntrophica TaxID=2880008 RepID=UPI002109AC7C|nr:hypothetical protein [Brucepastera parasyntrophica]ULQ60925.1 hypothetical protein K7I13_06605 [Brucepastera parasyntrophica]